MENMEDIIAENARRNALLKCDYDPITGIGCYGERDCITVPEDGEVWVPHEMVLNEPDSTFQNITTFRKARIKYDFEYWCAMCVTIRDKATGRNVKLILNRPQQRVLAELERQRKSGKGIRLILLKARQWGGSTLTLMYMAWIQIVLRRNWNSLICGHKRNSTSAIKGMYTRLLNRYPKEFLDNGVKLRFKTFEGNSSTKMIEGRGCIVIMGSAYSDDAVRGFDIAMAHLSEVAFWPDTPAHNGEDLMRSVDGSILLGDNTLIVMESTANGMGSFFHTEWLDAQAGMSDKTAIFVPWYEIELYRMPVNNVEALWDEMDDYERDLWYNEECTLEMINWYHHKRQSYHNHHKMMAEFPTNDIEAFSHSGHCIFDLKQLDELRKDCLPPIKTGDILDIDEKTVKAPTFVENDTENLKIWAYPDETAKIRYRYFVAVDIGGRSETADYTVMTVLDRKDGGESNPEVVAQWRGHIDHDLLVWKAAQLAKYYCNAWLIFESNTLESERNEGIDINDILNHLVHAYPHIYCREKEKIGFQTNKKTKGQIINNLMAMVRDHRYIERDHDAIDEMGWYELKPKGAYGAIKGQHDDIVMSRAIALYLAREYNLKQRSGKVSYEENTAKPKPFQPRLEFEEDKFDDLVPGKRNQSTQKINHHENNINHSASYFSSSQRGGSNTRRGF